MDCIDFNKDIGLYLDRGLEAAELNDFLHHMEDCPRCAEELEVNFIVQEGIRILNDETSCYDLTAAFGQNIRASCRWLAFRKVQKRIAYVVISLAIWSVVSSAVVCFGILF